MTRQPRPYIRSARGADKSAVLRFTEHTWDWGDYIQEVWDEWLAETTGRMLVVTVQREPVAVAHVSMVGPGEGWIEGMRVAPSFRQRGIAINLTRRCLAEAAVMGARAVRFVTAATNTPIHKMAASLGFRRLSALRPWRANAAAGRSELVALGRADADRVPGYLSASPVVAAMGRMASVGWRFRELGPEVVSDRLEKGLVKALIEGGRIQALAVFEPPVAEVAQAVSCVDAAGSFAFRLAASLKAEIVGRSPAEVMVWLPEGTPVVPAFSESGFTPVTDNAIWVFERVL
jgi:ribosomal protein S18 acetylase RimI-like enzyme